MAKYEVHAVDDFVTGNTELWMIGTDHLGRRVVLMSESVTVKVVDENQEGVVWDRSQYRPFFEASPPLRADMMEVVRAFSDFHLKQAGISLPSAVEVRMLREHIEYLEKQLESALQHERSLISQVVSRGS